MKNTKGPFRRPFRISARILATENLILSAPGSILTSE
jgi:hypothetical protein